VTLQQRRVLLERVRAEVERVVEEISATAETLRAIGAGGTGGAPTTETERAALRLLHDEQLRLQLELARLTGEYEALALRRPGQPRRPEPIAANAAPAAA